MKLGSTHFDMGFTLASTIVRTLQFFMFSGNSWIPREKQQTAQTLGGFKVQLHTIKSTSACCISAILLPLTQNTSPVKTTKMRDSARHLVRV